MFALPLILQNWKLLAFGVVLAGFLACCGILVLQRDGARAAATRLQAQVVQFQTANVSLKAQIDAQNAAIADLNQRAAAASARETAAANQAAVIARDGAARSDAFLRASVPSGCESAMQWLVAQSAELGKW